MPNDARAFDLNRKSTMADAAPVSTTKMAMVRR